MENQKDLCIRACEARENENYGEALDLYLKAYEAGNSNAANDIGSMYLHGYVGKGGSEGIKIAKSWYKKASDMGNVTACLNLVDLMLGNDLKKNEEAFNILLKFSKKKKDPKIISKIGEFYYWGDLGTENLRLAMNYFIEALELGSKDNYFLGLIYLYGFVEDAKNEEEGIKLLDEMSENKDMDSSIELLKYFYYKHDDEMIAKYSERLKELDYPNALERIILNEKDKSVNIYSKY